MNDLLNEISEKVVHKEQWNKVKEYMIELQQENERLNNIINKAIQYIEHAQNYTKEKYLYVNGDDVLDILKGSNK